LAERGKLAEAGRVAPPDASDSSRTVAYPALSSDGQGVHEGLGTVLKLPSEGMGGTQVGDDGRPGAGEGHRGRLGDPVQDLCRLAVAPAVEESAGAPAVDPDLVPVVEEAGWSGVRCGRVEAKWRVRWVGWLGRLARVALERWRRSPAERLNGGFRCRTTRSVVGSASCGCGAG